MAASSLDAIDWDSWQPAERIKLTPLRIGIINLMPEAETYESTLLRPLAGSALPVAPVWIRLATHSYSSSDAEHLQRSYRSFERAIAEAPLDGLILTGAPVEAVPFESVTYFDEVLEILRYAREHVSSTLGLCWGGLAIAKALGIDKVVYAKKLFGVYPLERLVPEHPLLQACEPLFACPQSRFAGIGDRELESAARAGSLRLLAHGSDTGYSIFESMDGRLLAHLGHPEYEPARLIYEYQRDSLAGRKDVALPINVDLARPRSTWHVHRSQFFRNWLSVVRSRVQSRALEHTSVAR